MAILEVKHLTKDYGNKRGVFDISFDVSKGEVYGFLGPNGAGKSTTIRHLMGFSKPDKGECRIFNQECFTHYYENLKSVGYIPGEIALPQGLNGYEFLEMMQKMQKKNNQDLMNKYISYFELDKASLKMNTKHMSLGIKRKLAIVTAFSSNPDVLILDEPTSGLDPLMQEKFIKLIKEEKSQGKTILLSSHIFSEVDATCDRIGIIKDGKIVSQFVADNLRHADKKNYRIHFANQNSYKEFKKNINIYPFISIIKFHDQTNVAFISCVDKDINALITSLSNYDIESFSTSHETLQDYFMSFYKEDESFKGAL